MIVTSTLRMQLDAAGFVKSAAQLAAAVEQDVKRLAELKAALKDTGGTERLQASLQKFGASAQHIEGVKRALEASRQELGITGKAWADLTADQKKALRSVESTAVAVVRSEIAEEKRLTTELARQAEVRTADLKREAERAADTKARMLRDAERQAKREQEILANIRRQEERDSTRRAELAARDAKRQADEEIRDAKRAADARIREAARAEAAEHQARERELADQRRHEEAMRHAQDRGGFRHMLANGVAGYVSAHGVVSGGERVLEKGAELQHERVQMGNAGISAAEIVRIQDQALRLSTIVGNISQTGVMETAKELRSIIADPHELEKVLDPIIRAKSVIDGMDTSGASSQGLAQLLKAAELVGAGKDPERITKLIDGWVKVMQVSGKTVNPEQIFEFVKYSKTAGATLSDRFLTTVGPSILQELGGSTTGNDIAMMSKTIATGFGKNHSAMREAARIGLINPGDIEYLKTGEAKGLKRGTEHAVAGDRLFQTDPDKWVYEVLIPLMEKAGIKAQEDQIAFTQRTFTGTAADFIAKTITQRQAYDTHAENYASAKGLGAVGSNANDAVIGLTSLKTAIGNLAGNVSAPVMAPIGRAFDMLASGINHVAEVAAEHPVAAPVIGGAVGAAALAGSGYLSWKAFTGFGMTAAKTQMTAAEMQLRAAGLEVSAATKQEAAAVKGGASFDGLSKVLMLIPAIQAAKDAHALDVPRRGGFAGAVEFLDPGLADRIYGRNLPEARTKDDVYAAPRTSTLSPESYWDRKKAYLRGDSDNPLLHKSAYVTGSRALPVDLTANTAAKGGLVEAVALGTYQGFRRVLDEHASQDGGSGGGGGVISASYEGGDFGGGGGGGGGGGVVRGGARARAAALPNMRYGRAGTGGFRDTPARGGPGPSTPLGRTGAKFSGKAPAIMRGLMDRYGLTQEQAAGVLGNLGHESAGFTAYHEGGQAPGRGGVGWAQWTGPRRRAFEAWTKAHGLDPTSDEASWRYLTEGDPETPGAIAAVRRTHDPHSAAMAFEGSFERAGVKAYGSRFKFADRAMALGPAASVTPAYADEGHRGFATSQRAAETAVLPRRAAPAVPDGLRTEAMNGAIGFDASQIHQAHAALRAFKQDLASLGTVGVDVKHNMGGRPGALRTALNGGYASDGRGWT